MAKRTKSPLDVIAEMDEEKRLSEQCMARAEMHMDRYYRLYSMLEDMDMKPLLKYIDEQGLAPNTVLNLCIKHVKTTKKTKTCDEAPQNTALSLLSAS